MTLLLPCTWGAGSALSITAGGLLAGQLARRSGMLLGVAAGLVFGIALFDLLPEAHRLAANTDLLRTVLAPTAAGFVGYMALEALSHSDRLGGGRLRRHVGPASLAAHATVDGFMVGIGFAISARVGLTIAIAVVAHGLVHGINTITLARSGGGDDRLGRRWLAINAAAPLVGIVVSRLVTVAQPSLAIVLAIVAGAFLYIATGELLPAARRDDGGVAFAVTLAMVGSGVLLIGG